MKKITFMGLSIAVLIALMGCASLTGFAEATNPIPLFDDGASLYAHISVKGNESLIETLVFNSTSDIDKKSLDSILSRSTTLYLALFGEQSNGLPKIQLALQGAFPTFLVNASLGSSQGWENESATINGAKYTFKKHVTGLELASISSSLVMVSTGSIAPTIDRYTRGIENTQNWPVAYNEAGVLDSILSIFETSSSVSVYIPQTKELLQTVLGIPLELPISYAFGIVTQHEDESITLDLQLKISNPSLVNNTLTVLRILSLASDIEAELIDEDIILVKNIPFTTLTYGENYGR